MYFLLAILLLVLIGVLRSILLNLDSIMVQRVPSIPIPDNRHTGYYITHISVCGLIGVVTLTTSPRLRYIREFVYIVR